MRRNAKSITASPDIVKHVEGLTKWNFMRTDGVVLRFKSYGALVSERWPTRLDLRCEHSCPAVDRTR